jgi:hypothetical protein
VNKELKLGIGVRDVLHHYKDKPISLEDWFKEISQCNIFDYVDKTPPKSDFNRYKKLSEKYNLPILSSGWFYLLGKDDDLILENLKMGAELGSKYHNVQIFINHADGHVLTDKEIANSYIKVAEYGEKIGCVPCFEIHINMWSEDFTRISSVAKIVKEQGMTFRMTLDHSHIIFKMNNKEEMVMFGLGQQLKERKIILDPFQKGNIAQQWIDEGYVWLMHARSAVPNNPKNIGGRHPNGSIGRGVQYPFIKPLEGQYHAEWEEEKLEPWKKIMKNVIKNHFVNDNSSLECITTEFIPNTDYGEGSTYSLFDNASACAQWIKNEIKKIN